MPKKSNRSPRDRFLYLRELVTEFQDTTSKDAKEQVLANLANFGYDPRNYCHFKQLNVVQLFLDHLDDENEKLVEFAIGGLCNIVLDKEIKEIVWSRGGFNKVVACLSSTNEETVISAMTTIMFLCTAKRRAEVTSPTVIDCMLRLSKSTNKRLSNLAHVYLKEYCTPVQVRAVQHLASSEQPSTHSMAASTSQSFAAGSSSQGTDT